MENVKELPSRELNVDESVEKLMLRTNMLLESRVLHSCECTCCGIVGIYIVL